MAGSLFGLYNAQRSLQLNQAVMDVINNNISNINTPGYSKQRAELAQLTSGNISTNPLKAANDVMGATINDISRNRDIYMDNSYRQESSDYYYFNELQSHAETIEDITGEMDSLGINASLDSFYESLSQLASNPSDIVTRNNVVQKAIEVTTKFNSIYGRMENLRTSLVGDPNNPNTLQSSKIHLVTNEINDKLASIANLNNSIILATSQGASPNYLLDERDQLLDQISELIPADIKYEVNGSTTVSIGNTNLVSGKEQVGFLTVQTNPNPAPAPDNDPALIQIENGTGGVLVPDASNILDSGKLGALIDIGGNESTDLTIKSIMDDLNTLAGEFAEQMNQLQTFDPATYVVGTTVEPRYLINSPAGLVLSDYQNGAGDAVPPNLFEDGAGGGLGSGTITAANICVSQDLIDDPYLLSAASSIDPDPDAPDINEIGDGSNALAMSQIRSTNLANLSGATTEQFIINLVGEIGSKASTINNNHEIKESVCMQLDMSREAITGVNLDEEMTDLIRFQRAYEASARIFSALDKNLQTIINMV